MLPHDPRPRPEPCNRGLSAPLGGVAIYSGSRAGGLNRHLIEQWLEDVVISPVDQNDFGVAPSKRSRGCDPSEASADNHDPRWLVPMHLHLGGFIVSLSHDHRNLHASARQIHGRIGIMLALKLAMIQHEPAMTRKR